MNTSHSQRSVILHNINYEHKAAICLLGPAETAVIMPGMVANKNVTPSSLNVTLVGTQLTGGGVGEKRLERALFAKPKGHVLLKCTKTV